MKEEEVEIAVKVVVVGNGAVGKSSMIQRYCKGIFTKDYKKTIGVDFLEKQISATGEDVRLMLWDTAGQEEFDSITKAYYRGAQACVLVFSTVDRASFDSMSRWKDKVHEECGDIAMVLVQNKIDLVDDSVIRPDEAEGLAKKLKLRFYRTSVKENLNVSDVFQYLAERYVEFLSGPDSHENQQQQQTQIGMFTTQTHPGDEAGNSRGSSKKKNGQSDTIQLGHNKKKKKKKMCFSV